MIFTERRITVHKGKSSINEPVILYRGDYEVSIKFTIMESKFRFKSGVNLVDSEKAPFGQLAILAPYGGNVFSEVVKCEDGTVTFTLTKEKIDQLEEVGLYSFQIRLFDYYRESRVSIPPVEFGIEVREPVASEDHDNEVNNAIVGYSIAKVVNPEGENIPETFDDNGNYNKTNWETGDRISEGKLNKIEDAIGQINRNTTILDGRITNDYNILMASKMDSWKGTQLQQQINDLVLSETGDDVNHEITQARGGYEILNDRLTAIDESIYSIYTGSDGVLIDAETNMSYENGLGYTIKFAFDDPITVNTVQISCIVRDLFSNMRCARIKIATKAEGTIDVNTPKIVTPPVFKIIENITVDKANVDRMYIHLWVEADAYPTSMRFIIEQLQYTINNKRYTPSIIKIHGDPASTTSITNVKRYNPYDIHSKIVELQNDMKEIEETNIICDKDATFNNYGTINDLSTYSTAYSEPYMNRDDVFEKGTKIKSLVIPMISDTSGTVELIVRAYNMNGKAVGKEYHFNVDVTNGTKEYKVKFSTPLTYEDGNFRIAFRTPNHKCLLYNKNEGIILVPSTTKEIEGRLAFKAIYMAKVSMSDKYVTKQDLHVSDRLYGKKIVAIGDSMVQGHTIPKDEGWLSMIANRNNMQYVNYGINGRYMTNKLYNNKKGVVESYMDMDDDADFIIVFAGTNDANNSSVSMGEDDSSNPAEFKGALNIICQGLLSKYPGKVIVFITPYYRDSRYPAYATAIETICGKYGIPVFNNIKNGGIYFQDTKHAELFTLGDNIHLNKAGMEIASYRYEGFLRQFC